MKYILTFLLAVPFAHANSVVYEGESGPGKGKHIVFHSTQGASQDFLGDNYRRMIVNGVLWAFGLEKEIKADLDISFVGPFNPSKFLLQWPCEKRQAV
jgi:hypothetical protein